MSDDRGDGLEEQVFTCECGTEHSARVEPGSGRLYRWTCAACGRSVANYPGGLDTELRRRIDADAAAAAEHGYDKPPMHGLDLS